MDVHGNDLSKSINRSPVNVLTCGCSCSLPTVVEAVLPAVALLETAGYLPAIVELEVAVIAVFLPFEAEAVIRPFSLPWFNEISDRVSSTTRDRAGAILYVLLCRFCSNALKMMLTSSSLLCHCELSVMWSRTTGTVRDY